MQNNTENQVHAGFFVRLIAYVVDALIIGFAQLLVMAQISIVELAVPLPFLTKDLIFQYSLVDIIAYAVGVAYFVLFTYHRGATLGKMLLHIRVVSTEERKLTFLEVLYRETIGRFLSGLILSVGYWFIIFHKEKKGLHDILSDTKVVYYFKKTVIVEVPVTVNEVKKPVILTEPSASGNEPANSQATSSSATNYMAPSYQPESYMVPSYLPVAEEPKMAEAEETETKMN